MNILIYDTAHPVLTQKLTQSGFNCEYLPEISLAEIEQSIHKYDGAIGRSKVTFDKKMIDKGKNLRFIGRLGAGMENIDMDYAGLKDICCFNSPEGNRDAVGEHAIAMLLNLINKINNADREVRMLQWNREANRGIELRGKTIGIIGYGNMGGAFAQKLSGFGANVIAYDKYKTGFSDEFVKESSMQTVFENAGIISLHVPLTEETRHMVNDGFLKKFKNPVVLINTSRGKVVNTDDLVKNLKSGHVTGVALDVLEYENESFENLGQDQIPESLKYLLACPRAVLTPHIAGWTIESNYKLAGILADKIITFFKK